MLTHQIGQPAPIRNAITGTSPTADTKLSSSNLLEIVRGAWESRIWQMPFLSSVTEPSTAPLSQVRRVFAYHDTRNNTPSVGGSRLSVELVMDTSIRRPVRQADGRPGGVVKKYTFGHVEASLRPGPKVNQRVVATDLVAQCPDGRYPFGFCVRVDVEPRHAHHRLFFDSDVF